MLLQFTPITMSIKKTYSNITVTLNIKTSRPNCLDSVLDLSCKTDYSVTYSSIPQRLWDVIECQIPIPCSVHSWVDYVFMITVFDIMDQCIHISKVGRRLSAVKDAAIMSSGICACKRVHCVLWEPAEAGKVASTWFKNIQSITEATEKHARVTLVTFAAGPQRKDSWSSATSISHWPGDAQMLKFFRAHRRGRKTKQICFHRTAGSSLQSWLAVRGLVQCAQSVNMRLGMLLKSFDCSLYYLWFNHEAWAWILRIIAFLLQYNLYSIK